MARVRPFAAFRYRRPDRDISDVTAPPYDVISADERVALLARDPHNVVALELPDGPLDPSVPGNRYATGAATWDAWRAEGTIVSDPARGIYVLEQLTPRGGDLVRRRAFIVEVGLEPFSAGVVLPHERTLPKALGDRFQLIRATAANFSQVLGLFADPGSETDALFDAIASDEPVATATDSDGVLSRLWVSSDPALAATLADLMAEKQIFIADGHHRYSTALAYRDERRAAAPLAEEDASDPAYDFVMMALVNMEDPELVVMATHRVADAASDFDSSSFYRALGRWFTVEDIPVGPSSVALSREGGPCYLVKTRSDDQPRLVSIRPGIDLDDVIALDRSSAWKHLDVAVLQELILDPVLGIHPDRPETLDRLSFVKNPDDAFKATAEHDVAFVLRPTRMDQLRAVATAGETMPQKSTYFYPKLLSGLVFRSAE
jgi:uncharacterized protein (DUF1015 family)